MQLSNDVIVVIRESDTRSQSIVALLKHAGVRVEIVTDTKVYKSLAKTTDEVVKVNRTEERIAKIEKMLAENALYDFPGRVKTNEIKRLEIELKALKESKI